MLEHRIDRLEAAVDGIGPQLTDIKVTQAKVVSKLDTLATSLDTVKDLAQAGVSAQLVHTRCATIQEERWRAHDAVHDSLITDLQNVIKVAAENKISIVKIMAISSASGVIGGSLVVPLFRLIEKLVTP